MDKFLDNEEKAYKSITKSLESLVQWTEILEDQVLQLMEVFVVYSAQTCNSMLTRGGTYYADPPWLEDVDRPHPKQPTENLASLWPQKPVEPEPHATPPDPQDKPQERSGPRQTDNEDDVTQRNEFVYTPPPSKPPLSYPQRQTKAKLDKQFFKFPEMLKQLHITILFTEVITSIPLYSKLLKEIISN